MIGSWVRFLFLGCLWGSSFVLIKASVREVDIFSLVAWRLWLAGGLFLLYLAVFRYPIPKTGWGALIFVGLVNTAFPFTLVYWAQTKIDSSMATILTATTPFFSMSLAHFLLPHERLTQERLVGLFVGFGGVGLLASRSFGGKENQLGAVGAMLLAALCYAICLIVMRRYLRHVQPIFIAASSVIIGGIGMLPTLYFFVPVWPQLHLVSSGTLWAVLSLALLQTFVAYLLFYGLIEEWGPRASLVTYATPPIGISLSVLIYKEPIDSRFLLGGLLIFAGIVLIQGLWTWRKKPVISG